MTADRISHRDSVDRLAAIRRELAKGLVGQDELVTGLLIGLLANGHVLIEGVPGLGKTRSVLLLSRICHARFKRIQFTPDLLPSDLVGTRIYNQHSATFETVLGPVVTNFLLADEINRAPAKVQSALLETMQERQVTIGKETHPLPAPFLVFATQNPIEQEGTYPLPEAQLDRFLLKLLVAYPEEREEREIVRMVLEETEAPSLSEILDYRDVLAMQAACREVFVEDRVIGYATSLVQATRDPGRKELELGRYIEFGASPRASIALAAAARAVALIEGRDHVLPDDVQTVAHPVLRHRIVPTYYADAEGIATDRMIDEILAMVKVP